MVQKYSQNFFVFAVYGSTVPVQLNQTSTEFPVPITSFFSFSGIGTLNPNAYSKKTLWANYVLVTGFDSPMEQTILTALEENDNNNSSILEGSESIENRPERHIICLEPTRECVLSLYRFLMGQQPPNNLNGHQFNHQFHDNDDDDTDGEYGEEEMEEVD